MLYPEMTLEKLRMWAETHAVLELLRVPAKMLSVKNSTYYSSWLWMYHQSDIPIQSIITRKTAIELSELSESTAPLEYQQAAIAFLHRALEDRVTALKEEEILLKEQKPSNPVLKNIWERLTTERSIIRKFSHPRTKRARYTGKLLLETKKRQLRYTEESFAWCGSAQRPEVTISLDTSREKTVGCTCTKGKIGTCDRLISAIDHTLEVLIDPNHQNFQDRIIETTSTPQWMVTLKELNTIIAQKPIPQEQELLGWRLKEQNNSLRVEPIWCRNISGQWKTRRADSEDLIDSYCSSIQSDIVATNLLQITKGYKRLSKEQRQNIHLQILNVLVDHPRVFSTPQSKHPIQVKYTSITLYLRKIPSGIELEFYIHKERILSQDLIVMLAKAEGNTLAIVQKSTCHIIKINNKIQEFVKSISQNHFLPTEALPSLMKQLHYLQHLFQIRLDDTEISNQSSINHQPCFFLELNTETDLTIVAKIKPFPHYPTLSIGNEPKTLYSWHNNQFYFGHRDFTKECNNLQRSVSILELEANKKHMWHLQDTEEIFSLIQRITLSPEIQTHWYSQAPSIHNISKLSDLTINISFKNKVYITSGFLAFGKKKFPLEAILRQLRKNTSYIFTQNNTWYTITDEIRRRLVYLADALSLKENTLFFYQAHCLQIQKALTNDISGDRSVLNNLLKNKSINPNLKDFCYELRPYQNKGVIFLLQSHTTSSGAILADEMGLGKTIQSLAFVYALKPDHPLIIITPKSMIPMWYIEVQKTLPEYTVFRYEGKQRSTSTLRPHSKTVFIMSYTVFTNDILELQQLRFSIAIFDEAQALKNATTVRSKAAKSLNADFKLLLSGTPIENRLSDLWSLFHCALPELLGPFSQFKFRFIAPIQSGNTTRISDLQRLIEPYFLQRKKSIVAKDLPPKIEINEFVELSDFEMDYYTKEKNKALHSTDNNASATQILALITKLRQLSCHRALIVQTAGIFSSKLQRALEITEELQQQKKKVLIFSQFIGFLTILKEKFKEREWSFNYIDGSYSTSRRETEIENFRKNQSTHFLLLSLRAGATGLNLHCATEVIHLDPWWNPALEDQASNRVHRLGQTQPVTIIRLISRNTIEEKILELHHHKRTLAQNFFYKPESLSLEELYSLLK